MNTQGDHLARGVEAEGLAVRFLQGRGFKLHHKNYRCRLGEIDLIVSNKRALHFVEVKGRWSVRKGDPLAQITSDKQRRLSRVATQFLQKFPQDESKQIFLSVIGIDFSGESPVIDWVPNAFPLSGDFY